MRRQRRYLVGGLGAAAAMLIVLLGLEAQVGAQVEAARRGVDPGTVNRALKGDRLPLIPRASDAKPAPRAPEPKLPDGCVGGFTSTKNVLSTEVPGRCVASADDIGRLIG